MKTKQNPKSWLKGNKLYILIFMGVWGESVLLVNQIGRGLGILLPEEVGLMSLASIIALIADSIYKNSHKISAFFKRNSLLLWLISGLVYMIAFPFIYVYYHAYIPTDLLIVLGYTVTVVAFFVSFIATILLASYLLRHFRIIYYPKGRRFE